MPFTYLPCKRQAALRLAQLIGTSQATLEAAYAGAWATALDGAEIPISGFLDIAMMVEKEIATVIGNNPNHPARSMLYGRSVNQASLDNTPTVDNNNVEWVGVFDAIIDAASGKPMTSQPPQTIEDLNNSFFDDTFGILIRKWQRGMLMDHRRYLKRVQVRWSMESAPIPHRWGGLIMHS